MQTLDYDLRGDVEHRDYEIPTGATGLNFKVQDGEEEVVLTVDGRSISLTVAGARDLAFALRQSANRIERQAFDRMGNRAKNQLGKRKIK